MNLYDRLLAYETDSARPADGRRVIGQERQTLHAARDRVAKLEKAKPRSDYRYTRDELLAELEQQRQAARDHLAAVATEAERVLGMWALVAGDDSPEDMVADRHADAVEGELYEQSRGR